jgi:hypothetical protein
VLDSSKSILEILALRANSVLLWATKGFAPGNGKKLGTQVRCPSLEFEEHVVPRCELGNLLLEVGNPDGATMGSSIGKIRSMLSLLLSFLAGNTFSI